MTYNVFGGTLNLTPQQVYITPGLYLECSGWGVTREQGVSSCPLPISPFPSLRSRPPKIQLDGLGEHCKPPPQRGLGRSRQTIWCILALHVTSRGNNFNNFPENQLTKKAMPSLGMMYSARGRLVWGQMRGVI